MKLTGVLQYHFLELALEKITMLCMLLDLKNGERIIKGLGSSFKICCLYGLEVTRKN